VICPISIAIFKPELRDSSDLQTCLDLLQSMNAEWSTAKRIHQVLSLLLGNIRARKASANGLLIVPRSEKFNPEEANNQTTDSVEPAWKKRKTTGSESSVRASPTKDNDTPSDPRIQLAEQGLPNTTPTPSLNGTQSPFVSLPNPENASFNDPTMTAWASGQPNTLLNPNGPISPSMLFSPSDFGYPQSNMFLPDHPANPDDPMFWGNLDFNAADIFGSATWENLTGSAGAVPPPGWNKHV
jgi:hypothetical protein